MSDWTTIKSAKCHGEDIWLMCKGRATITGILKCGDPKCNNEQPFTIVNNSLQELLPSLPVEVSQKLSVKVPTDIVADIKEAERSEYMQCHKAAATMCRRALQLELIDRGIPDKPLSSMIEDAKNRHLLDDKTYILAVSIKGFGDIGAHRKEILDRGDIQTLLSVAVKMLNELAEQTP